MKNLKMFAIAVMAFAVMAMGVHAATNTTTLTCTEASYNGTCTLTTQSGGNNITSAIITENTTIVTDGQTLTITSLTINPGVTLTIKGGKVVLANTALVTVKENAKLIITETKATDNALTLSGNTSTAKISVEPKGEFSVSDNLGRGIVVSRSSASTNPTALTIELDRATMNLNNNGYNASNGNMYIDADSSKIYVNNNGLGGLNAKLNLTRESSIEAKGNGLSGVTIWEDSNIEEGSSITATGNLTGKGADENLKKTLDERADITFKGSRNTTIGGKIVTDSMAPEKVLWTGDSRTVGTLDTPKILFEDSAVVDTKVSKSLCDTSALAGGGIGYGVSTCPAGQQHDVAVDANSEGALIVGNTATVYGAAKVSFTSAVTKVIAKNAGAEITVAGGTEVENASTGKVIVTEEGGSTSVVEAGKTNTIGEPTPVEPGTTEPGTTGDGNQGSTENVKNPETNDNILVYAGLGLVSLASVAFTAKKRED